MTKRRNIFYRSWAAVRFVVLWLWIILNVPIAAINPGGKLGVWQFRVLMGIICFLAGFRYKISGQLSKKRPLLLVGNHIASIEFGVLPAALGINFFGKAEIAKMPLIGFFSRKMGVQFIDRNPRRAKEMIKKIKEFTERASYPMVIFPEGTTTNGSYVHPFKSALFNILEPQLNGDADAAHFTVQPFVMHFRDGRGNVLTDDDLAENYASFDNAKQLQGRNDVRMRGEFEQVFHVMKLGGMTVEIELLPPPPLAGITDRHAVAEMLHKIISDKYMETKDRKR